MPARYSFSNGPIMPAVEAFRQRREVGDVREHRRDVAPLRAEVDIRRGVCQPVREIR